MLEAIGYGLLWTWLGVLILMWVCKTIEVVCGGGKHGPLS